MASLVIVGGGIQISLVTSAVSTAISMTAPGGIHAGDLLVWWNRARNNVGPPVALVPAGFTSIVNFTSTNSRGISAYRIADGAEIGFNAMNGGLQKDEMLYVFRGTSPISSVSVQSLHSEGTDNDPASQSVTSGSGLSPLVVLGCYGSTGAVNTRTFSPAKDGEINSSTSAYLAYKIYNSSPADETIDMNDEGTDNTLASYYLQCS